MTALDNLVVATSLPALGRSLQASLGDPRSTLGLLPACAGFFGITSGLIRAGRAAAGAAGPVV